MDREAYEYYLSSQPGRGRLEESPYAGYAGGAACGDTVRFSLACDGQQITAAGFQAEGCGALQASAGAAVELITGEGLLEAALISATAIADALGGLSPANQHGAELVADALAQALGRAALGVAHLPIKSTRTAVAMSGGVDSSLAALLCQEAGRETIALTVELWRDEENDSESSCCSVSAVRQARLQAHRLGIPHFTVDLRESFREGVVQPYLQSFREGLTPNPCVRCNGEVRIDAMMELGARLGAPELATGHYARLSREEEGSLLRLAVDHRKDQSYMLAGLRPESLARLRLPLGEMSKPEVRILAAEKGLISAKKPDSQDLCFLAGTTRARFLSRHGGVEARPGQILSLEGELLGEHPGASGFTVGQRKGLGVAAPHPLFVLRVDPRRNQVIVGPREQLRESEVKLAGLRLYRGSERVTHVKLRYKSEPIACELSEQYPAGQHRSARLRLHEPAEGVAPGQIACLLSGEMVVGLATISPK